ncbi:MAG TPA: hypothetical protein VFX61_16715 [Micromonosporaceae bacterium]|nr:hypothetical protein [Micromonosporaceae bacterium]
MTARDRAVLYLVAAAVTALVLAPLAAPGYALRYDMVFVPRQPLSWDLVAPTYSLPRAVPMDAVISLVTQFLPGWLVQRLALAGVIFMSAVGAGRVVPTRRQAIRLIAAVGYAWTPYLAERLLIGQWGLLVAYAALPWIVRAALLARSGRPGALPRLVLAAAPAAITPTGGLLALATVAVLFTARARWRVAAMTVGAVVALNTPWMFAAWFSAAGGSSDPAGVAAFAARAENWSGPLGALAGTGGIWSAQATPASRSAAVIPLVTLGALALGGVGFSRLRDRLPRGTAARLTLLAGGCLVLSSLGVLPGVEAGLRWLVESVPGAGLLRDGQKFLAPYALVLVMCGALGVERLVTRWPTVAASLLVGAALLPIAVMPDLACGGAGRLRPVSYPADWDQVAARVAGDPGEVLSLPLSAYRAYSWNSGQVVLDPLPRYLAADVLADDTLYVGDVLVNGENPRFREVRRLLSEGRPVTATGVRWVVVQHHTLGELDPSWLAGLRMVHEGPSLTLYLNPTVPADSGPPSFGFERWVMAVMLSFYVLGFIFAAIWVLRRPATAW